MFLLQARSVPTPTPSLRSSARDLRLRWSQLKLSVKAAASRYCRSRCRRQDPDIKIASEGHREEVSQALPNFGAYPRIPQEPLSEDFQHHTKREQRPNGKLFKRVLRRLCVGIFENGVSAVPSIYVSVGDMSVLAHVDPRPLDQGSLFTSRYPPGRTSTDYTEKDFSFDDTPQRRRWLCS